MKSNTKKIPFDKQLKLECGKKLQGFELMVETLSIGAMNVNSAKVLILGMHWM